jgi:hypothetical protein
MQSARLPTNSTVCVVCIDHFFIFVFYLCPICLTSGDCARRYASAGSHVFEGDCTGLDSRNFCVTVWFHLTPTEPQRSSRFPIGSARHTFSVGLREARFAHAARTQSQSRTVG